MDQYQTGRAGSQEERNPQPAQAAEGLPAEDMEALLRESDYAFRQLRRGETVEGTVVRVDPDEVLVDIGLKSEGVIPAREIGSDGDQAPPLEIGDRVLVYVLQPEGQEGHAILSLRRARMERSWREIEQLYHQGTIIEAPIVDFNKGGLIADVKGVRGFIPVSQILDLRNLTRQDGEGEEITQTLAAMKGRVLPLKIIEINRSRNRLILSERSAAQERRTQRKDELLEGLAPGQIRRGVVSNITTFGAFVDLGGADGLVHVSELSYNRVNHPSEVLQVGQEVDVSVLSVDRESKKIALSLKKALPDPWLTVEQRYHVGQVVPAVITKLAKFGAFAKVEEGLEGLIHTSEVTDLPVRDPAEVVQEGQRVNVKIIHINTARRRLGLSIRQAQDSQMQMESFGDVDDHLPFAQQGLGDYSDVATQAAPPAAVPDMDAAGEEGAEIPVEPEDAVDARIAADVEPSSMPLDDAAEEAPQTEAPADVNSVPAVNSELPELEPAVEATDSTERTTANAQEDAAPKAPATETTEDAAASDESRLEPPEAEVNGSSATSGVAHRSGSGVSTTEDDGPPEVASATPHSTVAE